MKRTHLWIAFWGELIIGQINLANGEVRWAETFTLLALISVIAFIFTPKTN